MKTSKENGQQELNRLIKMREICKEKLKNYDSPHDRKLLDSINDLIAKKATSQRYPMKCFEKDKHQGCLKSHLF